MAIVRIIIRSVINPRSVQNLRELSRGSESRLHHRYDSRDARHCLLRRCQTERKSQTEICRLDCDYGRTTAAAAAAAAVLEMRVLRLISSYFPLTNNHSVVARPSCCYELVSEFGRSCPYIGLLDVRMRIKINSEQKD